MIKVSSSLLEGSVGPAAVTGEARGLLEWGIRAVAPQLPRVASLETSSRLTATGTLSLVGLPDMERPPRVNGVAWEGRLVSEVQLHEVGADLSIAVTLRGVVSPYLRALESASSSVSFRMVASTSSSVDVFSSGPSSCRLAAAPAHARRTGPSAICERDVQYTPASI